jgi:hypothetical protein
MHVHLPAFNHLPTDANLTNHGKSTFSLGQQKEALVFVYLETCSAQISSSFAGTAVTLFFGFS